MEERQLRAHLIRLYCVTVAAVLLAVLLMTALLFAKDAAAQNRETFSALLFAVSDQLRMDDAVSHPGLRELERQNRLSLSLRENGAPLLFNSGDGEDKQALFLTVEQSARADGYDIAMPPLTGVRRTSPIYAFSQDGRPYLGAVSIIPFNSGYCTVTMVQRVSPLGMGKGAMLLFGYLASLLLLCVLGVRLIDRALLPAVESRKRQTQFVAAASHELRSPLAVIALNASTIHAQGGETASAAVAIENECARMSRLIGDLLLLASTDAKSWPVKLAPVEIDTVLLDAYELHAPLFARHGYRLLLHLPEDSLPRVTADGERLSQVLSILLDNALSYGVSPERPSVEIAGSALHKRVHITVCDHGPGLDSEQKARVFERFYRGDASRKEKQHFGLGLSIAKELVELQNGKLILEDTPGGGCTFRIIL